MFIRAALAGLILSLALMLGGCGGGVSSLLGITGTPTITGITPNPAARGSVITITGLSLNGTETSVFFNSTTAGTATVTASGGSQTSITVTVPTTLQAGTFNVFVETSDGQGDVSSPSNSVTISLT